MSELEAMRRVRGAAESGATELDLRGLGLSELPEMIWDLRRLEVLRLDQNELQDLPMSIGRLTALHTLSMQHNRSTRLPGSLEQIETLRHLFLDHNRFKRVPSVVWRLSHLESLGLSGIQQPNLNVLSHHHGLKKLLLNECGLDSLPNDVVELESLQELGLEGNHLHDLPLALLNCRELIMLDLALNEFVSVPSVLCHLQSLYYLGLRYNEIDSLPAQMVNLEKLRTLIVGNNPLQALPDWLGALPNLRSLFAYSTTLTALPAGLGNSRSLQDLWAGDNLLDALSPSFGNLDSLRVLHLTNNRFVQIPEAVYRLKRLERLALDRNEIVNLASEVGQLGYLESLDLRDNRIEVLPAEIGQLAELKVLRVGGNRLREVPRSIGRLQYLTELDISENRALVSLPASMVNLTGLQTVTLEGTGIPFSAELLENPAQFTAALYEEMPDWLDGEPSDLGELPEVDEGVAGGLGEIEIELLPDVAELPPDIDLLKVTEQTAEVEVLQVTWGDVGGDAPPLFPYERLELVYTFDRASLLSPAWLVARTFLARSQRFGTEESWFGGGMLAYETADSRESPHVARVDIENDTNQLTLTVTGPLPQNFFTLLVSGLERVIAGLDKAEVASRKIRCPDSQGTGCDYLIDFDTAVAQIDRYPLTHLRDCPRCEGEIDYERFLLGVHEQTEATAVALQGELAEQAAAVDLAEGVWRNYLYQLVVLRQRHYLSRFSAVQRGRRGDFLRLFLLHDFDERGTAVTTDDFFEHEFGLHLCCEMPGHVHVVKQIGLPSPELYLPQWWLYLQAMKEILPTIGETPVDDGLIEAQIEETIKIIDLLTAHLMAKHGEELFLRLYDRENEGLLVHARLALNDFFRLHQAEWEGALAKVRTPEGRYFWLCEEHARWFG